MKTPRLDPRFFQLAFQAILLTLGVLLRDFSLWPGQMALADLANYQPKRRAPLCHDLAAAGKTASHIEVYPGAQHGFHADYRPSFNQAAAEDGWRKMLAFFRQHGV